MSISARAVVVRAPREPARVEEITVEDPGPGEVRVRVLASGVCHTDLHAKLGNFTPEFPYLLGHEATGVVDALGPGVERPKVGETVILSWRSPCGRCRPCVAGNPVLCATPVKAQPRMRTADGAALGRVLGVGSFTTHTVVAAGQAIPVAADLAPEATCLIGCGVATGVGAVINAARVPAGARVAVFGCGAVGMSVILGARLAHAGRIVAVDLSTRKLEWARELGATDAVDASAGDPAKRIRELCGGVDYAFEAVGLPQTLAAAVNACDLGGKAVLIGVPGPGAQFSCSMVKLFYGRVTIIPTFCGDSLPARDFPLLADLHRQGHLPIDRLISRRITLDDVEDALGALERGEVLRSVIVMA